ncbi:O-antigen ligase family protein [Myroides sp. C8-3]|uniref:O-antigen ligase family protein n=1 Tax=Myroides sp. C8-3 TaxID=3400533 RepID=UPI003D2F538E
MDTIKGFSKIVFAIVFLTFLGFYLILLLANSFSPLGQNRALSIIIRMIIGGLLILIPFSRVFRKRMLNNVFLTKYFVVFSVVFLFRFIVDFNNETTYYIPYSNLLFYFISFCFLPFFILHRLELNSRDLQSIFKALLYSGLLFAILSIYYYGKFVGSVSRLTAVETGEEVLSPLILSYCSSLIIGVMMFYVFFNKTTKKTLLLISTCIILSIVPFFLGASRGALVAVFLPIVLFVFVTKKRIYKLYIILIVLLLGFGVTFLDSYLESGLIGRFSNTAQAIGDESDSAIRLRIWESSLQQFVNNPFLGDKLQMNFSNHYPHNVFVEVLQAFGLVGFIPFSILVIVCINYCIKMFKNYQDYAWISIIFLQALVQGFFSGSIFTSAWLWSSMALVIAVFNFLNSKEDNNKIKYYYK